MQLTIYQLKSAKHFAIEMSLKMQQHLKDRQRFMLLALNDYCKGFMSVNEYLNHIKAYNNVLLSYDYWKSRCFYLQQEINNLRSLQCHC